MITKWLVTCDRLIGTSDEYRISVLKTKKEALQFAKEHFPSKAEFTLTKRQFFRRPKEVLWDSIDTEYLFYIGEKEIISRKN